MSTKFKIMKFGGSSISGPDRIKNASKIVLERYKNNKNIIVVFSALGGTTDNLMDISLKAAMGDSSYLDQLSVFESFHKDITVNLLDDSTHKNGDILNFISVLITNLREILHGVFLIKEFSPKTRDYVLSFGERLSNSIISAYINSILIKEPESKKPSQYIDSRDFFITDNCFGSARIKIKQTTTNIIDFFSSKTGLFIFTGFIGSTSKKETTTLGRGGSDFTAAFIASVLDSDEVEIWSDVDGFMTVDPRKVKEAKNIESLTYEEAMELSHFGARVLYPPAIQPVLEKNIPIRLKNTFNPEHNGTIIGKKLVESQYDITGISAIDNVDLLRIQGSGMIGISGIAHRLFGALASSNINVIMITQGSSEHSICIAVDPSNSRLAGRLIKEEFSLEIKAHIIDKVEIEKKKTIIAVVGENMHKRIGLSRKLFKALADAGVNVVTTTQGSSELNITVAIESTDEIPAMQAIHDTFFRNGFRKIYLYIAGVTGLIGKELLSIIENRAAYISKNSRIKLEISGIINSRKMVMQNDIPPSEAVDKIESSNTKADMDSFINGILQKTHFNRVFIDCTAEKNIADRYENLLLSGISIVTPNKIANSSEYSYYRKLRKAKIIGNSSFCFETNIGAGLPVIGTLQNLVESGDKIDRIEAVLSGTMSYLFNTFSDSLKFSTVVNQAKKMGLTEPNPEGDLTGLDVARKLLILGRECGFEMEMNDITIENLVPKEIRNSKSAEIFLAGLEKYNDKFEEIKQRALKNNKVLRYIAKLKNGKGEVKLTEVDKTHPFYSLGGSDNIISFYTKRYVNPLVIKGSGAGAAVTASGVFSDIIKAVKS